MAKLTKETKFTLQLNDAEAQYLVALMACDGGSEPEASALFELLSEEVPFTPFGDNSDNYVRIVRRK